ncbi:uncharacterized protein I303_108098 [Kwoniella dejecticola CBS 10117]|uniref:Major facilitator superfamily (MFS) profile domain-containing protein n=1 Tax=Kwoniella dejecticola CBS 10117 TaxID=1296121 RepID=A0A1A5ZWI9_9TREE|nr:uncharacterized protein I303_08089 [Kwoniella dejecticola CBS 10117]OBR82175.1 hypothetical protein I303_08089 [Kwoniella dejecticola CBS 10117]
MDPKYLDSEAANERTVEVAHFDHEDIPALDPHEERRLLRKLDTYVISILGVLYLLSFLDRSNIGNANVAGMSVDLGLVGNQFGTCVSIVYATYVTFEPVYANLLKIVTPKILLSVSTLCWGCLTIATAWATNYHGLLAIRILLGATEAGLFPCVNMYLLMTYRREEIGRRLSFIYVCAALSGAFGGLLAYGLTQIHSSKLAGWQILYIVEGCVSTAFAPIAYFLVPNRVDESWFLNAKEKDMCKTRLQINRRFYNPDEHFNWRDVRRALLDWKTWCHGVNQFLIDITLYAFTTFMPTIIKGLGFSSYYAQLMTVPVYVVAALSFLVFGYFSDKYRMRSPFIVLACVFIIIGYVILLAAPQVGARYFGLYLVAVGLYPSTALNLAWCSGNAAGHFKRATASGTMQLIGNCAGAAIGYIFNAQSAPRYFKGLYVAVGATVLSIIITVVQALLIKRENERRAKIVRDGAQDLPELGDDNVHWTYLL